MTIIQANRVGIARGSRQVLQDVTLTIGAGEFIGVLGPNGAGKTTLLRAILGLEPVSGSLAVLGGPPQRGNPAIGYLPQTRSLNAQHISGYDMLANAATGHRLGLPLINAATRRDVARVLSLVDATELARRPLAALSGGERQRLLLGAALLGAPKLLLLDEPLISLDPSHQAATIELVAHLQRTLGLTVLFSAHDINPLLGAMTRVLYLGGGGAALGEVDAVITTPALTALYKAPIEVVRAGGRIFVISDQADHHAHL